MFASHTAGEGQSQGTSPGSQVAESLLPTSAPQLPGQDGPAAPGGRGACSGSWAGAEHEQRAEAVPSCVEACKGQACVLRKVELRSTGRD